MTRPKMSSAPGGAALTTTGWVATAIMFVFGAHAFLRGTTSRTVRMGAVPMVLQGWVGSLYAIGLIGGGRAPGRRPQAAERAGRADLDRGGGSGPRGRTAQGRRAPGSGRGR